MHLPEDPEATAFLLKLFADFADCGLSPTTSEARFGRLHWILEDDVIYVEVAYNKEGLIHVAWSGQPRRPEFDDRRCVWRSTKERWLVPSATNANHQRTLEEIAIYRTSRK